MHIFLRYLLIFLFFCSAFFIKSDNYVYNEITPNSFSFIPDIKQEIVLSVKNEECFVSSNRHDRTEISNQNKNNHLGFVFGFAIFQLKQNIFNRFIIYKNRLSFRYLLYKFLNNLRNSIYTRAP